MRSSTPAAVSIFTLPECQLLSNPGQFSNPTTERSHSRGGCGSVPFLPPSVLISPTSFISALIVPFFHAQIGNAERVQCTEHHKSIQAVLFKPNSITDWLVLQCVSLPIFCCHWYFYVLILYLLGVFVLTQHYIYKEGYIYTCIMVHVYDIIICS